MNNELKELGEHIAASMDADVISWSVDFGELNVEARADRIAQVLTFLRDDPLARFLTLIDICGVDYPSRSKRLEVVYHLLSMHNNARIRVKARIAEDETIATVTTVYPCADWFEREA
ncbi:MAG: NADH-quinone oxidoreductase subunit C, partial [Marinicaulis sp.]|nr:NADH-quinone oxidoreductase subunit C [Marinicaulis sp.]